MIQITINTIKKKTITTKEKTKFIHVVENGPSSRGLIFSPRVRIPEKEWASSCSYIKMNSGSFVIQ